MKFNQLTPEQQKAVFRKVPKKHIRKFTYFENKNNSLNAKMKLPFKIISIASVFIIFPFHILKEFYKVLMEEIKYSSFKTTIENIYYQPTKIETLSKEEFF